MARADPVLDRAPEIKFGSVGQYSISANIAARCATDAQARHPQGFLSRHMQQIRAFIFDGAVILDGAEYI